MTTFEQEFMERTKTARKAVKLSQEEMARALGIDQGRYKHYEGRSLLPHEYVAKFCAITRRTESWLFSGRNLKIVPKEDRTDKRRPSRNGSQLDN